MIKEQISNESIEALLRHLRHAQTRIVTLFKYDENTDTGENGTDSEIITTTCASEVNSDIGTTKDSAQKQGFRAVSKHAYNGWAMMEAFDNLIYWEEMSAFSSERNCLKSV